MKMKAEAGVVYLQDKERQSSHITLEARREAWARPSLLVLRQNSSAVPFVQTEAAALRQSVFCCSHLFAAPCSGSTSEHSQELLQSGLGCPRSMCRRLGTKEVLFGGGIFRRWGLVCMWIRSLGGTPKRGLRGPGLSSLSFGSWLMMGWGPCTPVTMGWSLMSPKQTGQAGMTWILQPCEQEQPHSLTRLQYRGLP